MKVVWLEASYQSDRNMGNGPYAYAQLQSLTYLRRVETSIQLFRPVYFQ